MNYLRVCIQKCAILVIIFSLSLCNNVALVTAAEYTDTIKDQFVRNILNKSVIFYEDFFQAIIYGDRISADENCENVTVLYDGAIFVHAPFMEKIFKDFCFDKNTDINGKEYINLKGFAEQNSFEYTKKDGLIVLSQDNSIINEISKYSVLIETLFGIFVSPKGSIIANGTLKKPYDSIYVAKENVKKVLKDIGYINEGINVYFRAGEYFIDQGIMFDGTDSGNEECKIVYGAYPGEQVFFEGGISIKGADFSQLTSQNILSRVPKKYQSSIMQVDLQKHGLKTLSNSVNPATIAVYYNCEPMDIARWPNNGYAKTGNVIRNGKDRSGIEFEVNEDNILNWGKAENAWIYGFWVWEWDANELKLTNINTEKRTVGTNTIPRYTPVPKGRNWYIYNLIEELDMQNEYYIDTQNSMLYIIPYASDIETGSFAQSNFQIPVLQDTMFSMKDTKYVEFKNITLENSQGGFFNMKATYNCGIYGCTLRNTAATAIIIEGEGQYNTVDSCDLYNLGSGAIEMSSGNRQKLIPGYGTVVNNKIYNTAIINRTNVHAMRLNGVANRMAHNQIHNTPHICASVWGNQNIFEYNEVFDVLTDGASDAGAMHSGRDPTMYDNEVRYNYFHDIPLNLAVLYMDDHSTGQIMHGNIFYNTSRGVFIHGGQYNEIYNNILIKPILEENELVLLQHSEKYTWDPKTLNVISSLPGWEPRLKSINAKDPIWLEKYPQLNDILERGYVYLPEHSVAYNNVAIYTNSVPGKKCIALSKTIGEGIVEVGDSYETTEDIGFKDLANMDLTLKDDAKIFDVLPGFQPIPFDKMGLYLNEYRKSFDNLKDFSLLYPSNTSTNVNADEIAFKWRTQPDTRLYHFEIASDRNFKNIIRDEIVKGNNIKIKNLRYGKTRYYWRVTAINQNAKNIKKGKTVLCKDGYFSFETAEKEVVNFEEAEKAIAEARATYENMSEGTQPGQYFAGIKNKMKNIISSFENKLSGDKLTQRMVDKYKKEFDEQYARIKGNRVSEVILINNMLETPTNWSFQINKAYFNAKNTGISWTRSASGDEEVMGYKAKKIDSYQILKYKARLDYENQNTWSYFGIRAMDSSSSYAQQVAYILIMKPQKNVVELQRYGTGKFLYIEYPCDQIKYGEDFIAEIGAIDQEDGSVKVIFRVNGVDIINYNDSDKPVKDSGYFIMGMAPESTNNTMSVMSLTQEDLKEKVQDEN